MPFKDIPTALGDVSLNSVTLTGAGPSTKKLYLSGNNFFTMLNSDGSSTDLSVDSGGTVTARGNVVAFGGASNSVTVAGAATGGNVLIGVTTGSTGPNLGAVIGNIKGTGALMAQVPDSATAGGNARGANAVDLQTSRTGATQVANGTQSGVLCGTQNTASANYAVAAGIQNTASGWGSAAVGGFLNVASGAYSSVRGTQGSAHGLSSADIVSAGQIAGIGDAQSGTYVLRGQSTGGAAVRLAADGLAAGSANVCNLPNNTAWGGIVYAIARDITAGSVNAGNWRGADMLIVRGANAASTSLVGVGSFVFVPSGASPPAVGNMVVSGDATNGGLNFTFTPPNTNTWDVVAVVRTNEVQ